MRLWNLLLLFPSIAESFSFSSNPKSTMKGVANIALTVDGFIADKNGGLDWLNNQPMIEGEDFGFAEFLASVDAILMGRNTFETVVQFGKGAWPYAKKPLFILT
jgi:dihydrofolate reductase